MSSDNKYRFIVTIIWYAILAAIIFFINIQILNYVALLFAAWLITGSLLGEPDKKLLVVKIFLTILLLVVYYFR